MHLFLSLQCQIITSVPCQEVHCCTPKLPWALRRCACRTGMQKSLKNTEAKCLEHWIKCRPRRNHFPRSQLKLRRRCQKNLKSKLRLTTKQAQQVSRNFRVFCSKKKSKTKLIPCLKVSREKRRSSLLKVNLAWIWKLRRTKHHGHRGKMTTSHDIWNSEKTSEISLFWNRVKFQLEAHYLNVRYRWANRLTFGIRGEVLHSF